MKNSIKLILILSIILSIGCRDDKKVLLNQNIEIEDNKEVEEENDIDIITREGHPKMYGSTEKAHKIWSDIEMKKILFADSRESYKDTNIIVMEGFKDDDKIKGVEIYFKNSYDSNNIELDEAVNILFDYLPLDIIEDYYVYKGAKKIYPKDEGTDKNTYYVLSYGLTEEDSNKYYSKEHDYAGQMTGIIELEQSGKINYVGITTFKPRWMSSLGMNGYVEDEWNIDISEYKRGTY